MHRIARASLACASLLAACAQGSSGPDQDPPGGGKGDYYGEDNRQQIGDANDPRVAQWARSIALVMNRHSLLSASSTRLSANPLTLGQSYELCDGERFADEPVLGFCSSYLVAPDLVATAGHCLDRTVCESIAFVFDFHRGGASEDPSAIPAANVYRCAEVLARQNAVGGGLDYALIRLDRPTTNRTPFALQATPPPVGGRVALLGYPSGILAKVDLAGRVLRHEGHRIRTSLDSFPGHSGGVVIDLATGAAFGVHVEGSSPSYVSDGACKRAAACEAVTLDTGGSCDGAVETTVDAFSACCTDGGGNNPPPPPPPDPQTCEDRCGAIGSVCACDLACTERGDCCEDFDATCRVGSDTPVCLDAGAPCDTNDQCSNVMCSCEGHLIIGESFVVPGRCVQRSCANLQQLCEARCTGDTPRLSYWTPTCSLD
jgi:hypothetical protein